jgi:hypothetical protein
VITVIISLAVFVCLCAVVYPFKPFKRRGTAFLWFLGLIFLNGLISIHSATHESPTPAPLVVAKTPSAQTLTSSPEPNWTYHQDTDEMTGVAISTACTVSTNELFLSFPYNGGTHGSLCFKHKGKSLSAYFYMSSGQFDCGIESCSLKFKFDDAAIQSYSGTESTTHETGLLFMEPEKRLLSAASKANRLKIQAPLYQEGNQVFLFNVSGLDSKQF